MTGQVEFNSHMDAVVRVAVDLVNATTPGTARGRPYRVPQGEELHRALHRALGHTDPTYRPEPSLTAADVRGLVTLGEHLRTVFESVHGGEADSAAATVNRLLAESGARPQLSRHDGEPWHLHFHGTEETGAASWTAGCATGLAIVLGGEYADRLGVCSAPGCDRVYVDTSRNGTRRFCSTACQSRVKAATYRQRHQA